MKEDILKNELRNSGYSKEEQYFYDLNLKLKKDRAEERQKTIVNPVKQVEEVRIRERPSTLGNRWWFSEEGII